MASEPWYKRVLMYFGVKFKPDQQKAEIEWNQITQNLGSMAIDPEDVVGYTIDVDKNSFKRAETK